MRPIRITIPLSLVLALGSACGGEGTDGGGPTSGSSVSTGGSASGSEAGGDGDTTDGGEAGGTSTSGGGSTTASAEDDGGSTSGVGSTGEGGGSTGDSGAPADDPVYPRPDNGECPGDTTVLPDGMGGWALNLCSAACNPDGTTCPPPDTGAVGGQCAFNPNSSAAPCETTDDCPNASDGETCVRNGAGTLVCLLPPSHCILVCSVSSQNCPEAMTCSPVGGDNGFCQYPP